MGSVRMSILLSILLALSGMAAITSAQSDTPNQFYGGVTLNGADAPTETVINAYIGEELRGSIVLVSAGEYGYDMNYLDVDGNASDDEGQTINFTVCGAVAIETAVWHVDAPPQMLDLTAVDDEAPEVTDATANPPSIVANGVETTQLTVNVTDGCRVGDVTVNLSAIGGSDAQVMQFSGGDMYSTDTSASTDTPPGTYYLYVNASDVFGTCNTSVCIPLEVTTALIGDINGDCKVDYRDLGILGATYGLSLGDSGYNAAADLNGDNTVNYRDLGMLGAHYGESV
jgi:hypothetical protein